MTPFKHILNRLKACAFFLRMLVCCVYVFCTVSVSAQNEESYAEILLKANKEYESGNFQDALTLATSCSIKRAIISDQWKAHRLITLIYIADNQPEQAKASAAKMLEVNPLYVPNKLKDPAELLTMLKQIVVIPKFSLGVAASLGTNTTFPEIGQGYMLAEYNKTYSAQNSFQAGLSFDYAINEHIALSTGVFVSKKAYQINYAFNNWSVQVNEALTYFDFPLQVKYILFPQKKLRYTIQGGGFVSNLLMANNHFKSSHQNAGETHELENLSSLSRRNTNAYGAVFGFGVNYTLGQGHLFLNTNYFHSFSSITNSAERFKNQELTYTYFYADDDIKLHNLAISIGYSFYVNYKVIQKK